MTKDFRDPGGEYHETLAMARKILERPYADPDDDLAMLSRELLRASEREAVYRKALRPFGDAKGVAGNDSWPDDAVFGGVKMSSWRRAAELTAAEGQEHA